MRSFRRSSPVVLGLSILIPLYGAFAARSAMAQEPMSGALVRMAELSVRRGVLKTVTPDYPKASIERGSQGVVVTTIRISTEGKVLTCRALEEPDREMGAAACSAVKQWLFKPMTVGRENPRPTNVDTKLTFYFRLEPGGKAVVTQPVVPPPGAASSTGRFTEIRQDGFASLSAKRTAMVILDIRERVEFQRGHRPGAVNIPAEEIDTRFGELGSPSVAVIDCPEFLRDACPMIAKGLSVHLPKTEIYVLVP